MNHQTPPIYKSGEPISIGDFVAYRKPNQYGYHGIVKKFQYEDWGMWNVFVECLNNNTKFSHIFEFCAHNLVKLSEEEKMLYLLST